MFNWLKKNTSATAVNLTTDVHSHLLPNLDDGVKSWQEMESIVKLFIKWGYRKLITTPHVMQDHYRNSSEGILKALTDVREYLILHDIPITIHAAAEYYLDEHLIKMLEENEPLLTFGDQLLLFETNFLSEPLTLNEFIFTATTRGYKPVLAHPERYLYLQNDMERIEDLINRGVLFQLNLGSLTGLYSKNVHSMAGKLIERGYVHILGSDCHNIQQAELIEQARKTRYFEKALTLGLINNTL